MKNRLREEWFLKRQQISPERRIQASENLIKKLIPLLSKATLVLSYSSIANELSTQKLNEILIQKNSLVLPRVEEENLWLYRVTNIHEQLVQRTFNIAEPDPKKCERVFLNQISHIIVPGIAFDCNNHRLGYGKGYYDKFLELLDREITTIGVGFTETFSTTPFPIKSHDIALDQIILV